MFREDRAKYEKTVKELAKSEDEKLRNTDPRIREIIEINEE